jgi:hypothetical protein
LQSLQWLVGRWHSDEGDSQSEEIWQPAQGDNMTGTFRLVVGGKAKFYEFMAIEADPAGPTLRILHFGPKLAGWEEKGKPLAYRLVSSAATRAIFEDQSGKDRFARIAYEVKAPKQLIIRLEPRDPGAVKTEEFHMTR